MKLLERLKQQLDASDFNKFVNVADSLKEVDTQSLYPLFCKAFTFEAIRKQTPNGETAEIPARIIQFWDQRVPPDDVLKCISQWREIDGFEHIMFDQHMAGTYIGATYGPTEIEAFEYCHHPAMRCDYFRLAYLAQYGGIYIDADNVPGRRHLKELLDGRGGLKLQFLCAGNNEMVSRERILTNTENKNLWRYYFNNDPIITKPNHPVIIRALRRATKEILLCKERREKASIHWVTGPDNLSLVLFDEFMHCIKTDSDFDFCGIEDWNAYGCQLWKLDYRGTDRDWRSGKSV
ncbi:mannosyltransferase OCH1-like enzyme [Rhodoblastus acidophilus]|uniref:glycosyltransferase family 32 protein n=1 Tax=Rhodoblastus acidophilus TaxID=1074 RepID=UPI002224AC55|nr:mannosyltransferase OCH1-like enzyme [Rhodoblastus acidophilus]